MRKTVKHLCALLALLSVLAVMLLPMTAMAAEANSAVTLKDAIAGTDATITLTGSFTLEEKIVVNRDVTIQGNHTITRADSYAGTLFEVASGKTLTLDGGLIIDGNNNYSFDSAQYEKDLADGENPTTKEDSAKWFTPEAGKPVATAFMITTTGGTVNLNKVTIQNSYSVNSGVVSAGAGSTVNLDGATIKHIAVTQNSGVAVNASGAGIVVNMKDGTVIDGNHVGGNHGMFKIYSGTVFNLSGGEIKNTTGWNSNGVAIGIYHATVNMSGGKISNNSSEYGPNNGRNAAVYVHSNGKFNMTGGEISGNRGRARGGLDAPYTDGANGSEVTISGDNVRIVGNEALNPQSTTHDVYGGTALSITAGTYSQDVTKFIPEGKHLYAFDNGDGTWTVKEGTKITYKLNGGTAEGNPEIYPLNESLTLKDPVREGFIFKGWTGANGTVPQKNLTITLNVYEAEFTANWEEELTTAPAGPAETQPPVAGLPQTGDNSSLMLFVLMMAASLAGMVVLARRRSHT